jgi:gas vesicle protein
MRRLARFLLGALTGSALGAALGVWLAPVTGAQLRALLRERWREALAEGRRAQLEAEQRILEEYRQMRERA